MKTAKLKREIFDKLRELANDKKPKKIIDVLILFGGEVRTSIFLSEDKTVNTQWLKSTYLLSFGIELNKKKIHSWVYNNIFEFEDLDENVLNKIKYYLAINGFKKICYTESFSKNGLFWNRQPIISSQIDKNKLGKSQKHYEIIISLREEAINGVVNSKIKKRIANKFGRSEEYIRRVLKGTKLKYMSDAKIRKEERMKSYKSMKNYLVSEGFVNYKTKYWVSSLGEIYKETNNYFKKVHKSMRENNRGYKYIQVSINSQPLHFHKVMAEIFISNPNNYKYVRTIDGDPKNFSLSNLEWTKYPASSRIIKSISKKDNTWLNFVIDNFISGIEMANFTKILADKAKNNKAFMNNKNKESTIYTTILKYSQDNKLFPIFNIRRDLNNSVFINRKIIERMKNDKTI